jgi:hypothetical protein
MCAHPTSIITIKKIMIRRECLVLNGDECDIRWERIDLAFFESLLLSRPSTWEITTTFFIRTENKSPSSGQLL